MSRIRANTITNQNANGAPNFPDGITVTGIVTATTTSQNITGDLTVSGNIGVGGTLTYEDVTNIDSVGIVTARSGINVSIGSSIGIGTDKPSASLYVHESNIAQGFTAHTDTAICAESSTNANIEIATGHNNTGALFFSDTGATGKGKIEYLHGSGGDLMTFHANGGERLRIGPAGQLGIGGANYGSSGQVLTSQGSSSAIQWATVSTPLVAYKAKESTFQRYSFSNNSWAELKSNFRISHTPAATGNTIIIHTQIYHTVENASYGGFANVTDQGSGSDEAMIGESNTSSGVGKQHILGSTYHNEMIRNTNGGNMWMGTHLWGYHVTENTNAHTFKLFGRMGNGTRYVGDNQMGQLMQMWEYQGNVMQ